MGLKDYTDTKNGPQLAVLKHAVIGDRIGEVKIEKGFLKFKGTMTDKHTKEVVHRSRFPTSSFGASKPIPQKTRVAKTILTKVRAYGLIHSGTMVFAMGVFKPKIRFVASIAPCPSHLSFVILFFLFSAVNIR